ncbi:MAG: ABC transporter ATP-binding protein [Paludibacteraceae bacterium]|nr:ABC transporter ATP-binding protein [Paludibacteraceae bacterium]
MHFFELLKRFIPPYKKDVVLNILFNLLSTVLSLFSFATIIPVLQILFGINERVAQNMSFDAVSTVDEWLSVVKNNMFYWLQMQIDERGAGWVLFLLGLALVVMTFLKVATSYMASYFMIPIRTGVLRDLRRMLYNKVIELPLSYFSEEHKGDIMSRMTSDIGEVEASIMSSLDMMFKDPIMILIYLFTLLFLSWKLTVFVLILLPLSGLLIGKVGKSLKTQSTRGQEQTAEILTQIEETLSGLRIVKAFNAEEKLKERFENLNNSTRRTFNKMNRRYVMAHPMSEFLGTMVIAILLWFGGRLILNEQSSLDAAQFIYYLVIFYSIINPAKDLTKAMYSIRKGAASLERIDKILLTPNNIEDPEHPVEIKSFEKEIEYRDVSFYYTAGIPVLKDINLKIKKGQTVALVGQSGSGKTTLADLLPRFYDVQQGQILIDGHDIREYTKYDLRELMGNVNQEAILFNDTFFNNISFGVQNATQADVERAARIANAHDFIMATPDGYQTSVGDRGCKLSGGQRQRISIARAILKNPPILILDEATSALDTESEKLVQQALESLMKNRTTLVIAHRLSTIKNADLICVVNQGQIVEVGKHDELMALNGYYTKLVQMQH